MTRMPASTREYQASAKLAPAADAMAADFPAMQLLSVAAGRHAVLLPRKYLRDSVRSRP